MKKIYILFLLIINFIFNSSFVNDYPQQLRIAYDCATEKLFSNELSYRQIYSFNNELRYVLFEGQKEYLIFDNYLEIFCEFSRECNSPYYNYVGSKAYYLGPGNYYIENGNKIINLITFNEITSNDLETYKYNEKISFAYNKKLIENDNLNRDLGTYEVPYSDYFRELHNNIGTNTPLLYNDSCTYVAFEILLSYYDSVLDDAFIDESYDVNTPKYFVDFSDLNYSAYFQSPGIDDNFHADMIQLGIDNVSILYVSNNSLSLYGLFDLADVYFENSNISYTCTYFNNFFDQPTYSYYHTIDCIDNDLPTIVRIMDDSTGFDHTVVAYAYENDGIYVHFGWKSNSSYSYMCINSYYIYSGIAFEFNVNHVHSNNYEWAIGDFTGTLCPCGLIECDHNYINSVATNNAFYHESYCGLCPYYYYEAHNFVTSGYYATCTVCGFTKNICTHINTSYSGTYNQYTHDMHCNICNETIAVPHTYHYLNGRYYCTVCPFSTKYIIDPAGGLL